MPNDDDQPAAEIIDDRFGSYAAYQNRSPAWGLLQTKASASGQKQSALNRGWKPLLRRERLNRVNASPVTQASAYSVAIDSRLALPPTAARFVLTVTSVPKRVR